MNMTEMLALLRGITVAQITKVVAKDEDIISFDGKEGCTVWSDDPFFDEERAKFTRQEWEETFRSYRHYFGFAMYSTGVDKEGSLYFQVSDHRSDDHFGFGRSHGSCEAVNPPRKGEWIAGIMELTGKGPRLRRWNKVSGFEVSIYHALMSEQTIREVLLREMEETNPSLANFARLVVNGNVEWYLLQRQQIPAGMEEAEAHFRRSQLDRTVYLTLHELRPHLWTRYKEAVLTSKLYSDTLPKPAPQPILDNLDGYSKSVGLNTPFASLELA